LPSPLATSAENGKVNSNSRSGPLIVTSL
jgi:hypothetical protein